MRRILIEALAEMSVSSYEMPTSNRLRGPHNNDTSPEINIVQFALYVKCVIRPDVVYGGFNFP